MMTLLENVRVREPVHELNLTEHLSTVFSVLVHLQHHHLPRALVGYLHTGRGGEELGSGVHSECVQRCYDFQAIST